MNKCHIKFKCQVGHWGDSPSMVFYHNATIDFFVWRGTQKTGNVVHAFYVVDLTLVGSTYYDMSWKWGYQSLFLNTCHIKFNVKLDNEEIFLVWICIPILLLIF